MTTNEILTLLVSLVSAVMAVTSLIRSRKTEAAQLRLSEEQLRLAEKQVQLDEITASLAAKQIEQIEEEDRQKQEPRFHVDLTKLGKSYNFLIANRGGGTAYNVNVELVDCRDSPLVGGNKLPIPELRADSRIKLLAAIHLGSPETYVVRLTWEDSTGNNHSDDFHVAL